MTFCYPIKIERAKAFLLRLVVHALYLAQYYVHPGASLASVEVWRVKGFLPMRGKEYYLHEPCQPILKKDRTYIRPTDRQGDTMRGRWREEGGDRGAKGGEREVRGRAKGGGKSNGGRTWGRGGKKLKTSYRKKM